MPSKVELLTQLRLERLEWQALLDTIGRGRMETPGAMGDWTFKDLLVHLTAWWRREIAVLEAARRNETPFPHPPESSVQMINRWLYDTNRDRPLTEVLYDVDATWHQFEEALQRFNEQELIEAERFPGLQGNALGPSTLNNFLGHWHEEHQPDIEKWLRAISN